ncbi:MAG: ABC transporter ATP-binding protein [Wenzhouxiangella sp.]
MSSSSTPDPPVLQVEQVGFSYADQAVLTSIDLQVPAGCIVGLVGPNGAGKSTLIRLICGRLQPDRGRILLDSGAAAQRNSIVGLVPQHIALYPHLSVVENISFFTRMAGMPSRLVPAAAESVLVRCDLEAVAHRRVGHLSGGWQRRVNIACGLGHGPRLLVLDEPTVGIDPPACDEIERLLQRLAGEGIALLITSHDLDQLERIADTLAFLAEGRVVATGSPRALLEEFFGRRRECRVRLEADAASGLVARLEANGFERDRADRGLLRALLEQDRAEHLQTELADQDTLREFAVRRPGLETLWRRLYGDSPERQA